jgi:hypothetical protein
VVYNIEGDREEVSEETVQNMKGEVTGASHCVLFPKWKGE